MTARVVTGVVALLAVAGAIYAIFGAGGPGGPRTRIDVVSFTRFDADIVAGSDVLHHDPARMAITIRDAAGRLAAHLREQDTWSTTVRSDSYTVAVTLSRPRRRARSCHTTVRAAGARTLVTFVVGRDDRCAVYADDGAATVRVPDLWQLAPEEAGCILRATGLRLRVYGNHGGLGRGCPPRRIEADIVLAVQRPNPETAVARGTPVAAALGCAELPHGCAPPP